MRTDSVITAICALVAVFLLATLVLAGKTAQAHENFGAISESIITIDGASVDYYVSIPPSVIEPIIPFHAAGSSFYEEYFTDGLKIRTANQDCIAGLVSTPTEQKSGRYIVSVSFICPRPITDLDIYVDLFFDLDKSHIQFIRISRASAPGEFNHQGAVTARSKNFYVADVSNPQSVLLWRSWSFFLFGVEHLLTGYDHILFLLSIIIAVASFGEAIKVITSFTIAHSITLALAFLGVISLPGSVVEPLIAVSIIYVAAENVIRKGRGRRWLVTFTFGLVHGLGFVGALKEITVSQGELITSLLSFNLGIEAGQLTIYLLMAPIIMLARKYLGADRSLKWSSIAILLAGAYWLIERTLF